MSYSGEVWCRWRTRLCVAVLALTPGALWSDSHVLQGSDRGFSGGLIEAQSARIEALEAQLAAAEAAAVDGQRAADALRAQVGALRAQLSELQTILAAQEAQMQVNEIELQNIGAQLNETLARLAFEQRQRDQEDGPCLELARSIAALLVTATPTHPEVQQMMRALPDRCG